MSASVNATDVGQTPQDQPRGATAAAPPIRDTDATADALIREMMAAQKHHAGREVMPEMDLDRWQDCQAAEPGSAPTRHPRTKFKLFRAKKAKGPVHAEAAEHPRSGWLARLFSTVFIRMKGYRPTRKHIFFAVVAGIVLLRPWLIPITLFVTFWVVLIAYFTVGPDRVAELVVASWQRLHARRPDLAEKLRQRAAVTAQFIDTALGRLPDRWRDGIHVPDFAPAQDIAADRPDPFDRLVREAQKG